MTRKILFLLNEEHINHLVNVEHDGTESVQEEHGGVLLPEGASLESIYCIECGVSLKEGEDYIMEDFFNPSRQLDAVKKREPWESDPDAWKNHGGDS